MSGGAVALLVMAGLNCGGSAGPPAAMHLTWDDDGIALTTLNGQAALVMVGAREDLQITGATTGLSVMITVEDDPPLTPKTFMCNQPAGTPSATFVYTDSSAGPLSPSPECTVKVTQVGGTGAPAVGTFSAVIVLSSGANRNITNGSFSVPHATPTN